MKKGTTEAIIAGILMLVLVFLALPKLAGKKKTANAGTAEATAPVPELLARIEKLKARATQAAPRIREKQMERASLPWGRDPFFASGLDNVKPPLVCTGILYAEGNPDAFALINDAPVREGEMIEGYLVAQITKDGVVLEKAGRKYVLRVGEE